MHRRTARVGVLRTAVHDCQPSARALNESVRTRATPRWGTAAQNGCARNECCYAETSQRTLQHETWAATRRAAPLRAQRGGPFGDMLQGL